MAEYTTDTPITPELLVGAIALELTHRPPNWERIDSYVTALRELEN